MTVPDQLSRLRWGILVPSLLWLGIAILVLRAAAIGVFAPLGAQAPLGFVAHAPQAEDIAIRAAATGRLSPGEAEAVAAWSRALIADHPLSFNATYAAAQAAATLDTPAQTATLMALAAKRNPRNRVVRAWLADYRLRDGDYPGALVELDAIIRMQPGLAAPMTQAMVPFLLAPGMTDAFTDVAARGADWIPQFLDQARRDPRVVGQVYDLTQKLLDHDPSLISESAAAPVIQSAVGRGDFRAARALLLSSMSEARGDPQNLVVDPSFQHGGSTHPFAWRIPETMVGPVSIDASEGLSIRLGSSGPAILAGQQLTAGPGNYVFTSMSRGPSAGQGDALQWQIRCEGIAAPVFAASLRQSSREAGNPGVLVSIPVGCRAPTLALAVTRPVASIEARVTSASLRPLS